MIQSALGRKITRWTRHKKQKVGAARFSTTNSRYDSLLTHQTTPRAECIAAACARVCTADPCGACSRQLVVKSQLPIFTLPTLTFFNIFRASKLRSCSKKRMFLCARKFTNSCGSCALRLGGTSKRLEPTRVAAVRAAQFGSSRSRRRSQAGALATSRFSPCVRHVSEGSPQADAG